MGCSVGSRPSGYSSPEEFKFPLGRGAAEGRQGLQPPMAWFHRTVPAGPGQGWAGQSSTPLGPPGASLDRPQGETEAWGGQAGLSPRR